VEVSLWNIVVVAMTTQGICRMVILSMVFAYAISVVVKTTITASVIGVKPDIVANVCTVGTADMK
jgi:hypothetical protein